MSRALKDAAYSELARVGKAFANPHRVEILDVLSQAPRDVESLARATSRSVASTSQHLQVLAAAHMVTRERHGQRVVYAIAPGVAALLAGVERVGMARLAELPAHRAAWLARHPTVHTVPEDELTELLRADRVVLLDVRPREEFDFGHVDGARSMPLEDLDEALQALPHDREIIACCRGPWCTWADEAVVRLTEAGFRARRYEGRVGAE